MSLARILRYAPWGVEGDFTAIDYVVQLTVRLQPVLTRDASGWLIQREFFESATRQPDGTLVGVGPVFVRESYTYTFDADDNLESRDKLIEWFAEDDTICATKTRGPRVYSITEALEQGKLARKNVIDRIQMQTLGLIVMTTGWDNATATASGGSFMLSIQAQTQNYVEASDKTALVNAIAAAPSATWSWLENDIGGGVTIRQFMIGSLP